MIDIKGFTKVFGDFVAVDDLHMTVQAGDVFGFIGPNGAGKSTTIRFLATLLKPTAGDATVNGFRVTRQPMDVKRSIGFMPDIFGVYDGMKVWEFLDFFASAYRIPLAKRRRAIQDVLELLELTHRRDDYVSALSRGLKQRLCLAKTLVHDPPVLILDEPASGLDPRARIELQALLTELQHMGKTILISSHILSELAGCCNRIGIIERGQLLAQGTLAEIQKQFHQHRVLQIVVLERANDAQRIIGRHPRTRNLDALDHALTVEFAGDDGEVAGLLGSLVEAGIQVLRFSEQVPSLQDVFMRVTKGIVS